jgi:hypothetical protein
MSALVVLSDLFIRLLQPCCFGQQGVEAGCGLGGVEEVF